MKQAETSPVRRVRAYPVTGVIYAGTFVVLALVGTLTAVTYRSAVADAVQQRSTQQLAMVRTAAVGLQGELQGLTARVRQYGSIPSTQYLDIPFMAPRLNAAFSDNPNDVVQAVVRIGADGRRYEWSPDGTLTTNGEPALLPTDAWSRVSDAGRRDIAAVNRVWWRRDAPPYMQALVVPVWRTAASDMHPSPPNDFNGLLAVVFDARRLADVYLGPALVDLVADDLVVGLGVADLGLLMNARTPGVRVSSNDVHDHPEPQGITELDDAGGRRLHAWTRFVANDASWIVAASSSYARAAAGIQRSAAAQLGLTAALLLAVPLAGWLLVRHERLAQAEQRRLERQLAGAQKMEAIGKLAGGVAHDFNNQLTAVLGYASLIQEDAPEGSPLAEHAGQIRRAADNAAVLTQKLLAFSRKQLLHADLCDFTQMLGRLSQLLSHSMSDRTTITVDAEPGLWLVLADATEVEKAMINLATNASDAMPGGGTLSVVARNLALPYGERRADVEVRPGEYVMIVVTDSGAGMDDATKARMFEPFFTTKRAGQGTGLGLATVYGFVKQCGGYVTVRSAPGAGTTVELLLPRAPFPSTETAAPLDLVPRDATSGPKTVLVAEDEEAVRELTVAVLERLGYRVLVATSGEQAIRVAREFGEPIDLLLTDVVMPGMKGPELAERLTRLNPSTRVLLMSGYAADLMTSADLQGAPLIPKPFSPGALTKAVQDVLGRSPLSPAPGSAA